jgi:toxin ParE1/3/4
VASFRVELHPSASAESQAVHLWYRKRSAIVADAFTAELDRAMRAIGEAPHRWPPYLVKYRQFYLRDFPYSIYYRELPDKVWVVAVAAHRKRPDYWQRRK